MCPTARVPDGKVPNGTRIDHSTELGVTRRTQRAHPATGRGSFYFGEPQFRLTEVQLAALAAIRAVKDARRAAASLASRARARRGAKAVAAPSSGTRGFARFVTTEG